MYARAAARNIQALQYDSIPPQALRWGKIAFKDTLGVALAGSLEDTSRIPRTLFSLRTDAESPVLGTTRRAAPLDACFLNGISAHALDYDDGNDAMGGHPSAPLVPALLALASCQRLSGQDLLLAYVAGFEVETRLGRAVHFHHYEKGWHPTATLGVFGSAAACARALRLDEKRTAMALAIAASLASGLKANFGTMTKPLHVGHCSRNGLMAAMLARDGFSANPDVFEHDQGFGNVFNGPGTFDFDRALDGWGAPLMLLETGIGIKLYPCCAGTHSAIDAVLDLYQAGMPPPEDIASVEVRVHARRLPHVNRPVLSAALDAKFSLQYCTARALCDGEVLIRHFAADNYREARVASLMSRVTVGASGPDAPLYGAQVTLRTRDGREMSHLVERARGRGIGRPLDDRDINAKFIDCATTVLGRAASWRLLERLDAMEHLENAAELGELCTSDRTTT